MEILGYRFMGLGHPVGFPFGVGTCLRAWSLGVGPTSMF